MPLLEKQFQAAAVNHLCQLADLAREDNAWLESSAEVRLLLTTKEDGGAWRIPVQELVNLDAQPDEPKIADNLRPRNAAEAMSKRLIRLLVKKAKPHAGQLSSIHVDAVLHLAQQPDSGKTLHLPGGVEVRRERDFLFFRPMSQNPAAQSAAKPYCYAVDLPSGQAEVHLLKHSCALRFTVIDWPQQGGETSVRGAVLDRDRLGVPLVIRNWLPGDSVRLLGHERRHRLSRLLNEVGVSRWEKPSWPVLTSGGAIAWTRGLPVAAEFAVSSSTRTGVVITEVPLS